MKARIKFPDRRLRIGLSGCCVDTGLGSQNRSLWRRRFDLNITTWLVAEHGQLGFQSLPEDEGIIRSSPALIGDWLDSIDVLLAIERTEPKDLFELAHKHGCRTVLVVNAEWADLGKPWFHHADFFIAPNDHCADHMLELGIPAHRSAVVHWPVDPIGPKRLVERADRFVFANGWGGCHRRKGADVIREVLERRPGCIAVASQVKEEWPRGTELLGAFDDQAQLYARGDVFVQPSLYEGSNLQQLETLALGIPVITTDAAPMNEPLRGALGPWAELLLLPVKHVRTVSVWAKKWPAHYADPEAILTTTDGLRESDLGEMSAQIAAYMEQTHGEPAWKILAEVLQQAGAVAQRGP